MTKLLQWGFPASFVWSCYVKLLQWGFPASFVWSCYVAYLLVGDQCPASGFQPASGLPARESSIDMYNNDVGKKSAQKFMKQTGDLKAATLYFAS